MFMKKMGMVLFAALWTMGAASQASGGEERSFVPVQAQPGQDLQALLDEGQAAWDNRSDEASLEEALSIYERAMPMAPSNVQVQLAERVSHGYYLLAYGFHSDDKSTQQDFYERGSDIAEACLMLDPAVQRAGDIESAAGSISQSFAGCAFWASANLGQWANLEGLRARMGERSKIVALVSRVEQLDPTYFHGAVDRFWGSYYAVLPGLMGGDMGRSREHFEQALDIEPDYFGTRVLMAKELATREGDRELYQTLLQAVIEGDPDALPAAAEENRIEQRRARELLQDIDNQF